MNGYPMYLELDLTADRPDSDPGTDYYDRPGFDADGRDVLEIVSDDRLPIDLGPARLLRCAA